MTVVRDALGRLLLHSAIALDAHGMRSLLALGTPTWLVVPNGHHRLDAPAYKAAFPRLTVIAPAGSSARVARVVPVDMTYDEFPQHDQISMLTAPWPDAGEGVIEVRSGAESTLVFNDLIFNPPANGIYRLLRQGPQVSWLARITYAPDRARLRAWLLELSERKGLERIIPGHGQPITNNAAATLRYIATTC